jgi:hypothetical protein
MSYDRWPSCPPSEESHAWTNEISGMRIHTMDGGIGHGHDI